MNSTELQHDTLRYLTYIPFIGWMYPLYKNYRDQVTVHHARQAFVLAAGMTAVLIGLYIMAMFLPSSWRYVRFAFVLFIYCIEAVYLVACVIGTLQLKKGVIRDLPVVKKFTHLIEI